MSPARTQPVFSWWLFATVTLLVLCWWISPALAQTITDGGVNEGFRCINGSPSGQFLITKDCPDGPGDGKVFSYFVCQFESLLNEVLSQVYCSIAWEAKPTVQAALTLMISLTGVAFLMGYTPFTAKELMMLLFKFCLVLAFATEAEYMIGVGYALFIAIAKEGIVIVLSYLFESRSFTSGGDVYRMFDQVLSDFISTATQGEAEDAECENAIFSMMVVVSAALPPLAVMAVYFLFRILWVFIRSVFGYCVGLLGISFLVTLAPIYVSFALFKPTRTLFDKWIQYLISFSFQMVIVFAFLGMAFNIMQKMADDLSDYTDLVRPYEQQVNPAPGLYTPFDVCGICELGPTDADGKPTCASDEAVPLTELTKNHEFLEFATVKIMAILIMFYVLDMMMDFVPMMARYLAGARHAGQLGFGQDSNMSIPGMQGVSNSLAAGAQAAMASGTTPGGIVAGLGAAGRHAVSGDGGVVDYMIRSVGNPQEPFRQQDDMDRSVISTLFGTALGLTGAGAAVGSVMGSGGSAGDSGGEPTAPRAEAPTPPTRSSAASVAMAANIQQALQRAAAGASFNELVLAIRTAANTDDPQMLREALAAIDRSELTPDQISALDSLMNG